MTIASTPSGDVRDLDQVLLLQIQPGVRVREEQPAADGAEQRENERGTRGRGRGRCGPATRRCRRRRPAGRRCGAGTPRDSACSPRIRAARAATRRDRCGRAGSRRGRGTRAASAAPIARRPVACTRASRPMTSTKSPAQWWLNSDQARSASVRGALRSSTGISTIFGDVSTGHRGVKRTPTSASEARSATTSPAGGNDVSDAATNSTVAPRPNSTSTKRRRRASETSAASRQASHGEEVGRAQEREPAEDRDLRENHAAVGGAEERARAVHVGERESHTREDQDHDRDEAPSSRSA